LIRRTPDIDVAMEFSRCTRDLPRHEDRILPLIRQSPVSQNSTAYETSRSTYVLGELGSPTAEAI
jgi:hypothetical protein